MGPRREKAEQIRASESQLRSILITAPDVILTVRRDGTILFINRTLDPYTVEGIVGTSCFDYVPPDSRPRVAQAIEHVFTTRLIDEYEVQGPPGATGERNWSSVRVGPLIDGDQVIGATFCATDITERKRDEEHRRELFERLQKIAGQLPGMVFQFKMRPDGSYCFPYASEQIREIYRVTPDDVRDDAAKVFVMKHPDDLPGVMESIAQSAKAMTPWQQEYRIRFSDGEIRWLYGNAVPERQGDGSTLWHGFITDVTQRRQADALKVQLEGQLRQSQKVESIGKLAGGVAHDFNNLLSTVLGYTELALRELPPGSDAADNLKFVMEAAHRGAALTQQLLAFARKKIVSPEVVNLNDVVGRMAPMMRRLLGEDLDLALTLAPELAPTKVDVGSLEQVIMNLVVNARDAIVGGGHIRVETANVDLTAADCRTRPDSVPGSYVMLGVSDTGCGMTPDVLSRIFEPFFTTKPVGQGTGLGLAMCHGIVKQGGGNIAVYSEPGGGTTFQVFLPRLREATIATAPQQSQVDASSVAGSETVLLVEDEKMILRLSREVLTGLGYRVLTASDGAQALRMAADTPDRIDLLITDVIMPNMGGRELAARLQKLRPDIRVVYSSGYPEDAVAEKGVLREGINFLQKPYTPTMLAACVRDVLDRR